MNFDSKVALVTGAGSGVGRAIGQRLGRGGAIVVATDINESAAQETATRILEEGGVASASKYDTANAGDAESVVQQVVAEHGGLHLAVNNAGIGGAPNAIGNLDLAMWDRMIAINLTGVAMVCISKCPRSLRQAVAPLSTCLRLPVPWALL